MAKYFELLNDSRRVIVDDQFNTPKFLVKKDVYTSSEADPSPRKVDMKTFAYGYRLTVVAEANTLRELGFDYEDTDDQLVLARIMVFCRASSPQAYGVEPYLEKNSTTGKWRLGVIAASDEPGALITVCMYTTAKMLPSKLGLLVYNAANELVFDALKGYLQHVGILNGGVSVGNQIAATYTTTIPQGMSYDNLFISMRSALPFYGAYKLSSSGVAFGYTYYYPVMSSPTPTTMQVQLVQQRSVAGDSAAIRYSGYFENVIYCPYPKDVYTGYGN